MITSDLLDFTKKFIPADDDTGMTAALFHEFDALALGATRPTLMHIAALSLIFAEMQQPGVETELPKKFAELTELAKKGQMISGINIFDRLPQDRTFSITIKQTDEVKPSVPAVSADLVEA